MSGGLVLLSGGWVSGAGRPPASGPLSGLCGNAVFACGDVMMARSAYRWVATALFAKYCDLRIYCFRPRCLPRRAGALDASVWFADLSSVHNHESATGRHNAAGQHARGTAVDNAPFALDSLCQLRAGCPLPRRWPSCRLA